jgi:hypothetical protein
MYAQDLIEFSALTSWIASSVDEVMRAINDWFGQATPMTWVVLGAVVVLVLIVWRRL